MISTVDSQRGTIKKPTEPKGNGTGSSTNLKLMRICLNESNAQCVGR